jgi:hypothetical protein
MPVFGGVAKVRIGGDTYLFDKVYASLYLGVPLPVDANVCTEFLGVWRCGQTIIPAGTLDIVGERWFGGPIPVLDTDLAYSLVSVPSSEIEVVARRDSSYDPVWDYVAIDRGYLYMFIYDLLSDRQDFDVYCKDEDGYQTADTYIRGPTVFFAYYYNVSGFENGGYGNCAYVRMSTRNYYYSSQAPIVLRISNVAYITPIRIALFAYGRGILPGTKKDWLTAMVDVTSISL